MGIQIFNSLLFHIKDLFHSIKQLKLVLTNFLFSNYFCTVNEYFNYSTISNFGWLHIFPFIITSFVAFHDI
jgi:hypothetical protein